MKKTLTSIRAHYVAEGVTAFYAAEGANYRNPHEKIIRDVLQKIVPEWPLDLTHVLDLACGSGEITLKLREMGCAAIDGIDPYTGAAYFDRTRQVAEAFSFEDIAAGMLKGRRYSLIVCSFALHLVAISRLPLLLFQLSEIADALLILTPHKRPILKPEWGWHLNAECVINKVRARHYKKIN